MRVPPFVSKSHPLGLVISFPSYQKKAHWDSQTDLHVVVLGPTNLHMGFGDAFLDLLVSSVAVSGLYRYTHLAVLYIQSWAARSWVARGNLSVCLP